VTDDLPGAAGVEVGRDDTVYVAGGTSGLVFAVSPGGTVTEPARLFGRGTGFVSDLVVDPDRGRLPVTETFGDAVHEAPLDGGETSVFVRDPLLGTVSFGANGPALGPGGDAVRRGRTDRSRRRPPRRRKRPERGSARQQSRGG